MAFYSVKVLLSTKCIHYTGLFLSNQEAQRQACADYPEARIVSVLFLWRLM